MAYYEIGEIAPRKPAAGVEVRIVHGERLTVGFFTIAPGAAVPEHAHPHEQIGTVLTGRMELTIAGDKRLVSAGAAYQIPPDATHSARCLEGPAEVIEIFAPVREDWR
ncbi:MAG: cupin domain-containing protein [Desulfobacterales bacterium]|jgi:quercetin dioxygenase-like cupin family protein|nr:cupin domain-containing protein [Desulfobacterales bacterium]